MNNCLYWDLFYSSNYRTVFLLHIHRLPENRKEKLSVNRSTQSFSSPSMSHIDIEQIWQQQRLLVLKSLLFPPRLYWCMSLWLIKAGLVSLFFHYDSVSFEMTQQSLSYLASLHVFTIKRKTKKKRGRKTRQLKEHLSIKIKGWRSVYRSISECF